MTPQEKDVLLLSKLILARGDVKQREQLLNDAFPRMTKDAVFRVASLLITVLMQLDSVAPSEIYRTAELYKTGHAFEDIVKQLKDEGIEL